MSTTTHHPILTQHFDSSDVAFAQIEKEIAALQEGIRALLGFRNTFTPTYRLPPEILTRVFSFVRYVPQVDESQAKKKLLRWIAVTHVSQHWRNVAIGSPSLWSCICSSYPKRIAEEWLQRSKDAALSFNWQGTPSLDPQLVSTSLFRTRDLALDLTLNGWKTLLPLLTPSAPLLESLIISFTNNPPPSPIPENLFSGITPRLRHLELRGCNIDINSSLFMDLTSLELRKPRHKFPTTDVLNILSKLPRLVSVVLCSVLDQSADLASPNVDIVALNSLKLLYIQGESFDRDLDLLSHLSFPTNSTVYFYSNSWKGDVVTALSDFLSVHKAVRQASSTIRISSIELQCSDSTLTLYLNLGRVEPGYVAGLLKLVLGGRWDHPSLPDTPKIATLFSYLPLTALYSFETNFSLAMGTWSRIFGALPKLKHISVVGEGADNVLSVIINDFKSKCPPGYGAELERKRRKGQVQSGGHEMVQATSASSSFTWDPIFPKLESLGLDQSEYFTHLVEDLVAVLRARKKVDKGIKKIEVMGCRDVDDDIVNGLEDIVDVDWDGWTGSDSSEDNDEEEEEEEEDNEDVFAEFEAREANMFGRLGQGLGSTGIWPRWYYN
ncbi:hypothetical protein BDN72DRAFT_963916 [Pluteus cervinus]|uniref:Uncharacterized protein n=1 Tax=Pluteus cervinus TaxID=181527 RepID=A0ACD3ACI1_9AGAR|nr:hypothetical protein BDN72DRAFT_963916 [Pluteus cervinus]